jgi:hypothetical protein
MGLEMFSVLVVSLFVFSLLVMAVTVVTIATVGEGHRDEAQRHGHRKQQCQS